LQHCQQEKAGKVSNDTQDLTLRAELAETNNCSVLCCGQKEAPRSVQSGGFNCLAGLARQDPEKHSENPEGQKPDVYPEGGISYWLNSCQQRHCQKTDAGYDRTGSAT